MTRRSNGEGSITQRKDGRYVVRVTDPNTGKRTSSYFHTEPEATVALRRMATRAESGEVVVSARSTLRVWVADWLVDRAGRRRRESTVRQYGQSLTTYVLPHIGRIKVGELTALDVDDLLSTLAAKGLSASTIKGALVALSASLEDARRGRLIASNPARGAQIPERAKRTTEVTVATPDQVRKLLAKVKGGDLEPLVMLLLTSGARIGEALAMRWSDLDGNRWIISTTTTTTATGAVRIGDRTKTGASRVVVLPPETMRLLRKQRKTVAAMQLHAGALWQDLGLVFPSGIGTVQHSQNVRTDFRTAALATGFPGSFHALRHFAASAALAQLPVAVVAKQLGHRKTSLTTDVYGHLLPDNAASMGQLVSALVSKSGTKS